MGGVGLPKKKAAVSDKKGKAVASGINLKESVRNKYKLGGKEHVKYYTEYLLLTLMSLAVMLILFVGPFYRGLFFPRELIAVNTIVFGLLIFWGLFRILKNDGRLLNSPMEICLAVLLIAYIVSFFVAVHKRDALAETLKNASYIVIYLVSLDISRYYHFPWGKFAAKTDVKENQAISNRLSGVNLLFHFALISAFVISLASLAVATGNLDLPSAYEGGRIASPIGYSNTAAAYLMAAYLLAVALVPLAKKWYRAVYLVPATILLLTVILTFSRGAWLLLIPLCFLLVIVSAPGERLRTSLNIAASFLTAIPMAFIANSMFQSFYPAQAWFVIAVAGIIAFFLGLGVDFYFSQSGKKQLILAGAASAILVLFVVVVFIIPAFSPLSLSNHEDKLSESSLQQVIQSVAANEQYNLDFEIAASTDGKLSNEEISWKVLVLAGLPGYQYEELLLRQGDINSQWGEQSFSFRTPNEINRLEIHLYNETPGTELDIKSVVLSTSDRKKNLSFLAYRLMPERFYDRIYSFSRDINMDRRFELFQDAIRVIKDYPWLGTGGGGWAAVYKSYQDHYYNSRQIHNQYLQVWVEAGVFAFIAFIGIWISFSIAFILNCIRGRARPNEWQSWTAVYIPVVALGAHSLIDWNFAMASVGYYLFVLVGIGMSLDRVKWFKWSDPNRNQSGSGGVIIGVLSIIIGIVLFVFSIGLFAGLHATWRSQELVNQRNMKAAVREMERAISLDPLRAENYHNMNIIIEEQVVRTGDPEAMQPVISLAQKAYELEPYNITYSNRFGQLLLHYVSVEEGLALLDRSLELNPYNAGNYLYSAFSRLNLAEFYIQTGYQKEAEHYLVEIMEINQAMMEKNIVSKDMAFVLGRAYQLLGDDMTALSYLETVGEGDSFYKEAQQYINGIMENDE
jgi:tetratricopeptide (TPR) repeat protein